VPRLDAGLAREKRTRAELDAYGAERLRELLAHAVREVPLYAERFGRVARDPETLAGEAFASLPALEKSDLAGAPERVLARGRADSGRGVSAVTSGGTTGPPTRIVLDAETVDAHTAASLRTFLWWGADPTRRHAMLWGCPPEENAYLSLAGRVRGAVLGRTMLPTYGLDADTARRHFEHLCTRTWDHLAGYSSALVKVALSARPEERPRVRAGIAAAAEPLFDFQREHVERAFGCPVRDRYGSNEFAAIAHACREGGIHVASDRVRVDLVGEDGAPVRRGEVGRVLVTDLDGRLMPLIRYRIGDLAAWGGECGCGLPFPTLARVYGRERDALRGAAGEPLTPHDFAAALAGTSARGLQIVAGPGRRPRELHVEGDAFALGDAPERWRALAGAALVVKFVDEVRRSRSGKVLPVLEQDA
jgi:phenylacetate-CoA ligase